MRARAFVWAASFWGQHQRFSWQETRFKNPAAPYCPGDAVSHKCTNGERVGNIEFGYRLCADAKHVEPDPAEQAVLDETRNLCRSGHTMRGIATPLTTEGTGREWLEHLARITKLAALQR